ncbi:MAG: 2-oxo acid dehydrogenase subunit E2 [Deltaproteobacteria bacterium]|nr:2-oxo acid dehydrogenase subunit E2 [Deltaproteobacteria bacterium]
MLTVIEMPSLSSTMSKGTVVKWHKREGDPIEKGETLFEVQTDKVNVEVDALVSGFLRRILVGEGIEVPVNTPIAIISEDMDEDISSFMEKPSSASPPATREAPAEAESDDSRSVKIKISPLARRMAEEEGIDIQAIEGTGPEGRITKQDIERAVAERRLRPPLPGKADAADEPRGEMEGYEDLELTPMRRIVAQRLQQSKVTSPHFYVEVTADAMGLKQARDAIQSGMVEQVDRITFNDILIRIVSLALRKFPMVNASLLNDRIRVHKAIHIGVAVAVDDGLIVPVIRNVDQKTVLQISREMTELAGRARNKRLLPHEYEGGTFTITNMGMFGVESFHAIINPPESAILAVGAITAQAVVVEGEITVRPCMKLSLSVDHRVVDGALAARFVVYLKELVETPLLMLQ